jgi:hypothetical protein
MKRKAHVSATCEVLRSITTLDACGKPTVAYYPAAGGGTMALCEEHAPPHAAYTKPFPEPVASRKPFV